MKRFFSVCLALAAYFTMWAATVTSSSNFPTYYASLDNTSGSTLFTAIHNAAKVGYSSLSYSGLWTAFNAIDVRSDGKMYDYYSSSTSYTPTTNQCGNYSGEGGCYNREHSIPKSWFGGSESNGTPGTDLFHLVPTDGFVNSKRSNYTFGEVNSATYSSNGSYSKLGTAKSITISNVMITNGSYSSTTSPVFEPNDEYKGDFARAYMGAMVRWASDYQAFTTGDGSAIFNGTYTQAGNYGLTNYGVALLMKWHRQDPVSQREKDRNDGIQSKQGNRNPFIDYPELAEYLWGNKAGQTVRVANLVAYSNSGTSGGGSTTTTYTLTWLANGQTYTTTQCTNGKLTLPANPTPCDGYNFAGWTTTSTISNSSVCPTLAAANDNVSANTTFYAVYSQTTSSGTTTTGSSTVSFDFGNLASANNWANGTAYTTVTLNNVTLTASGSDNDGKYYISDKSWRIYSGGSVSIQSTSGSITAVSTTPSATFTIQNGRATYSASSNIKFTKIDVTVAGGSASGQTTYSLSCTEPLQQYQMTWMANGQTYSTSTVTEGETLSLPATNPTPCQGYTFEGWTASSTIRNASQRPTIVTSSTAVSGNTTYYAVYKKTSDNTYSLTCTDIREEYQMTWMANGQTYTTFTVMEGETLTVPDTDPTPCEGYSFVGWTTTTEVSGTEEPNLSVTGDDVSASSTFYAVYLKTSDLTYSLTCTDDTGETEEEENTFIFYKVTSITSGQRYVIAASTSSSSVVVAQPLDNTKSYGYLAVSNMTEMDGSITLSDTTNTFLIKQTNGGYTIVDSYGRYLYMSGNYNSFNVSSSLPSSGYVWSISFDSDGKASIYNTEKNKTIQYSSTYTSYGVYSDLSNTLPSLYKRSKDHWPTATEDVSADSAKVVLIDGHLFIRKDNQLYDMLGRRIQ